jgi:hypothetical protein
MSTPSCSRQKSPRPLSERSSKYSPLLRLESELQVDPSSLFNADLVSFLASIAPSSNRYMFDWYPARMSPEEKSLVRKLDVTVVGLCVLFPLFSASVA